MAGIERKGQQLGSIRVEEVVVPDDGDLSTLLKADLVQLATEAGIDATGMTKAEIVEALQAKPEG